MTPLSTPLSHLLVAFTIELDNEFERRFSQAGGGARVASVVMWSNFLRFVGDGIAVGELPVAAGLPKNRLLSTLGGMERWRYIAVGPARKTKRDGFGGARGLRDDWVVRATPAGEKAREIWPGLFGEIERRWEERFGARAVEELRGALAALTGDGRLPEYLPIVTTAGGLAAEVPDSDRSNDPPAHLLGLLAQVLLAYTLDFERRSEASLPLSANVLRVLDERGRDVRELPSAASVSPEAIAMALTVLKKQGHALVHGKEVRLTARGRRARDAAPALHDDVLEGWNGRLGHTRIDRLREAMQALLEQRDGSRPRLALGLEPYPDGWRASPKYAHRTEALLADPLSALPNYPMVLHRGGWPDGS
jgi:hypothetical protein